LQGGGESSLANHPGTILALGHLFTKEIIKKIKRQILVSFFKFHIHTYYTRRGFRMKKFLAIFMVILGASIMLASQEMQMELLTYWKTNEIEYVESDESILLPITEYGKFSVFIMKEYDSIFFVFTIDTQTEDFDTFIFETEKLPYSREFRIDLIACFIENLNYFTTFRKTPDPYYEWIGDYLVHVNFFVVENDAFLEID
jgi:hypothetical protein